MTMSRRQSVVTDDATTVRAAGRLATWLAPRATCLVPLLLALGMGYRRRWVSEDAFISMRVVRNILQGHGPVFNVGERVEAYTHPLWVGILSLWGLVGLPLPEGSVILGLAFTALGLVAAQVAALRLTRALGPGDRPWLAMPAGAIVFAVLPIAWDYVTSGLETGLSLAWLGTAFWFLTRATTSPPGRRRAVVAAAVIGLGPLVRPDLGVFSVGFLLVLLMVTLPDRSHRLRDGAALLAAAGALPLVYQVFRMGYFAALVPNTALAKEASASRWGQGWRYLVDFAAPYWLLVPVTGLLIWLGALLLAGRPASRRLLAVALVGPVCGALHALYVVRVGGDFMHGRFLLPSLFGLLLPVAAVAVPLPLARTRRLAFDVAALTLVLVWAVVAAGWLRVPYPAGIGPDDIADERGVYALNSGHPNPITLADYVNMRQTWPRDGLAWRALADAGERVVVIDDRRYPLAPRFDDADVVAFGHNIGLSGWAAGQDVVIVDQYGLADPVASRLALLQRGRPGHEKKMPSAWVIARFADPAASDDPAVADARAALACGPVPELLAAVDEPLTLGRFVANVRDAWKLHRLRIPPDPSAARTALCR